ncbi:hypothetical protein EDB85DRAFT_1891376 [Lactarius pseudohatsudake]|nr:hypothetical protein EDB85DRAFT_1891376 [Lactarius pseudohatsudake]
MPPTKNTKPWTKNARPRSEIAWRNPETPTVARKRRRSPDQEQGHAHRSAGRRKGEEDLLFIAEEPARRTRCDYAYPGGRTSSVWGLRTRREEARAGGQTPTDEEPGLGTHRDNARLGGPSSTDKAGIQCDGKHADGPASRPLEAETRRQTSTETINRRRGPRTIAWAGRKPPVSPGDPIPAPRSPTPSADDIPPLATPLDVFLKHVDTFLAGFESAAPPPPEPSPLPSPPPSPPSPLPLAEAALLEARVKFDHFLDTLLAADKPAAPPPQPRSDYLSSHLHYVLWNDAVNAAPVDPLPAFPLAVPNPTASSSTAPAAEPAQTTTKKPRLPTTKKPPIHDPGAIRKRRMRNALTLEELKRYRDETPRWKFADE